MIRLMIPLLLGLFMFGTPTMGSVYGAVTINEIMADTDNVVTDAAGNFEDWIELYNTGAETADLTGYYLTDDPDDLTKWQFPDGTTLPAGGYQIVWTDDDAEETGDQGELHTNFKLAAAGETIILVDPNGVVVEQIDFGQQTTDIALARSPNGTGNFVFQTATFNENNDTVSTTNGVDPNGIRIYPNPASNQLTVELAPGSSVRVALFDALGRRVRTQRAFGTLTLDVRDLPAGAYWLYVGDVGGVRVLLR